MTSVKGATSPPALTIAIAQGKFGVGNVRGNGNRISAFHRTASRLHADLVIFPELALSGYPPQDLLFDRDFLAMHEKILLECAALTREGCALMLGAVKQDDKLLRNAAYLFARGETLGTQNKRCLPNRGVFDEKRYYTAGLESQMMRLAGNRIGILICEDAWTPNVARELSAAGAQILICLNASPFETGKLAEREWICKMRAHETGLPLVYLNSVSAQDDLVFDGNSFVMNAQGEITSRMHAFREDFQVVNFYSTKGRLSPGSAAVAGTLREDELAYNALVFAIREFAARNGYVGAVLGLSGGIDSALCAAIAVDAFGSDMVESLFLPSPITSAESREDALECATRLGIKCDELPIEPAMTAFSYMVGEMPDVVTEENQTRIRAGLLLARARKATKLLINTGNKSEIATGFTTMYGDLCGHYSPIKDVYKMAVYRLAAWRNSRGNPIPERIFHKAPSAELFAGQRDEDDLPPYAILDAILESLLEKEMTLEEISCLGHEREVVMEVQRRLDLAQHKRHQAPPGPKISRKALASERRYPISNGWYLERTLASRTQS